MAENLFRIAVVQPRTYARAWGKVFAFTFDDDAPPETRNLDDALNYVVEAAANGARYIAFPEMYPGPMSLESALSLEAVTRAMSIQAQNCSVWIMFGGAEPLADGLSNTYNLISPSGKLAARYRKMIPACGEPWIPGDQPQVVDTGGLKIGLAVCWEAWFPEIARALAFMSADVIFFPSGALIYELAPRWRVILAARAAENLVYTAASVNLLALEAGMAVINSPEEEISSSIDPGIIYATLDVERLAYLRRTDEKLAVPKKYRSIPGLTHALRPELLRQLQQSATNA
jgi:predicted amidohydrolase